MPPPATFTPVALRTLPSNLSLPGPYSDPLEGPSPSLESSFLRILEIYILFI